MPRIALIPHCDRKILMCFSFENIRKKRDENALRLYPPGNMEFFLICADLAARPILLLSIATKGGKNALFSPRYRIRPVIPVRLTIVVTCVPSIITFEHEKRSGVQSLSGGKAEHLTGLTAVPT